MSDSRVFPDLTADEAVAVAARMRSVLRGLPSTGGCTEWSCPLHGQINRQRAELERELRKLDP